MAKKVLNYNEVLTLLKEGGEILYFGGFDPSASIYLGNGFVTVRLDTLRKLKKQGLIAIFDPATLHTKIRLKSGS